MRPFVLGLLIISLASQTSSLQAQGPFGRPGFGPGFGIRPPLPLIPVPGVYRVAPSYVRVPGVTLVQPRYVTPVGPTFGYRSTTIVAFPLTPAIVPLPYSAARIAIIQTAPSSASVYRAGSANYRTAEAEPTTSNGTSSVNDLRPGMVLPDGAVVVSVGQTTAPDATAGQAPDDEIPSVAQPASPNPSPVAKTTESILETAELPRPSASRSSGRPSDKPTTKKF